MADDTSLQGGPPCVRSTDVRAQYFLQRNVFHYYARTIVTTVHNRNVFHCKWRTSNKSLMLCKKVCNGRALRHPANQEEAKQALTPVIIIQLAPR